MHLHNILQLYILHCTNTNRKVDDHLLKLTLTLKINHEEITVLGIPYKYCVYTSKTFEKDSQYECIYSTFGDVPSDFANRYLKFKDNKS